MKKLMILAAVAATAFAAVAAQLDPGTATEAQVRAAMAEVLACTNKSAMWNCGCSNRFWRAVELRKFAAIRTEADDALAAKGFGTFWNKVSSWPKTSALERERLGAAAAYPKSIATATRLGADVAAQSFLPAGGTLDDLAVWLSEAVAFPTNCSFTVRAFDRFKRAIQKESLKAVKRYFRRQGRSFVTKNGVNPCEEFATALTTALNAPRFAGLDAWLKSVGFKGVDLSALPSEEEVAKLRSDVLLGDKNMTPRNTAIFYICLGVDGYNAFVREYNGD